VLKNQVNCLKIFFEKKEKLSNNLFLKKIKSKNELK